MRTNIRWDNNMPTQIKGDLIAHDGVDNSRVAVGANDTVLASDSTALAGVAFKSLDSALGYVKGPASSTDRAIVFWDGVTGKLVRNYSAAPRGDSSGNLQWSSTKAAQFGSANAEIKSNSDGSLDVVVVDVLSIEAATIIQVQSAHPGDIVLGANGFSVVPNTDDGVSIGSDSLRYSSLKAFKIHLVAGSSSGQIVKVGGLLSVNATTVGNIGTGEDTLMSYSVPANSMSANGASIWFEASGAIAGTAATKRLRVVWGSTTFLDTSTSIPTSTALIWHLRGRIIRTGASAQKCYAALTLDSATFPGTAAYDTASESLSGAVALKVTGEATNNDDIVQETMVVGHHPAIT